jgi:hypothetical protein
LIVIGFFTLVTVDTSFPIRAITLRIFSSYDAVAAALRDVAITGIACGRASGTKPALIANTTVNKKMAY